MSSPLGNKSFSQEGQLFLHDYEIPFRDSCSFPYIKMFLKVSDPAFEKNPTRVNKLKTANYDEKLVLLSWLICMKKSIYRDTWK